MAKLTKKQTTYHVSADITSTVSVEVVAASIEEALQKASTLKEENFVDYNGELIDSSLEVIGVYKAA